MQNLGAHEVKGQGYPSSLGETALLRLLLKRTLILINTNGYGLKIFAFSWAEYKSLKGEQLTINKELSDRSSYIR